MGNHILNSSFNLSESQTSSMNCCPYYYTNDIKQSGSQLGQIFTDVNAYFTSDLIGGLIRFANSGENNSQIQSAVVLDVLSTTTLLLDRIQDMDLVDYIIWYGGVQFSQQGTLAIKNLVIDGVPYGSLFKPIVLSSTTPAQYVPSAGVKNIYIQLVGGGGAGGGYITGNNSCGGGGGAGGYIQYYGPADTFTYTCGAAGLGNAGVIGGDGGNTLIGGSTIIGDLTAGGGKGGFLGTISSGAVSPLGGTGGVATGGTFNFNGSDGDPGVLSLPGLFGLGGRGAPSQLGIGGHETSIVSTGVTAPTGVDATGNGSGGSGAVAFTSQAIGSGAGGDGSPGIIFVYEI